MDGSKRSIEIVLYFGPEVKDLQNLCPYWDAVIVAMTRASEGT